LDPDRPHGFTTYVIVHCGTGEIPPAEVTYYSLNEPAVDLTLAVPDPPQTVMLGESGDRELQVTDASVAVNGLQALIHYNPVNLQLSGIAPEVSWWEIIETDTNGDIAYVAHRFGGSVGPGAGPFTVATLTFICVDDGTPVVSFLPDTRRPIRRCPHTILRPRTVWPCCQARR